ncbi:hypothetical protein BCR34DRAFT_572999 [Clohesyomyces aquaticus]|uniref:Uncharacterized protein n=1 Tax=Clohesyomyces aquaticus TaxID=1231657 RepID=A0A1Y1Z1N9_9PLEO|nr:hypothetical protein BCR34DRAFT_572999 [Clohesyomyces aquaticus]
MDEETIHRRLTSGRRSMESTMVEVGGPRVQFTPGSQAWKGKMPADHESMSSKKDTRPQTPYWSIRATAGNSRARSDKGSKKSVAPVASASSAKSTAVRHDKDKAYASSEAHEHYEQRVRSAYRHYDPGPPSSPPSRQLEQMYVRHVSPPAPRRSSTPHPNATTASERPPSMYGARSQAPLPSNRGAASPPRENKDRDLDEVTASDTASQNSGEFEIMRSWRGVDEHGQPCTFVEERTTKYVGESPRAEPKKGKWREL